MIICMCMYVFTYVYTHTHPKDLISKLLLDYNERYVFLVACLNVKAAPCSINSILFHENL